MAKALLGHVGPDLRLIAEMRRLQAQVRELESEVGRLREANAALAANVHVTDDLLSLTVPEAEPALT